MCREITLRGGLVTLVDDADYDWLSAFTWYPVEGRHGAIYASRQGATGTRHMQRDILDPDGVAPRNRLVDHCDGTTLNNQRFNLRWSSYSQSNANRRLFKTNTSGFRGVHVAGRGGQFVASIKIESKRLVLGRFSSAEAAAHAYNRAAKEAYGEFARLNVIPAVSGQLEIDI